MCGYCRGLHQPGEHSGTCVDLTWWAGLPHEDQARATPWDHRDMVDSPLTGNEIMSGLRAAIAYSCSHLGLTLFQGSAVLWALMWAWCFFALVLVVLLQTLLAVHWATCLVGRASHGDPARPTPWGLRGMVGSLPGKVITHRLRAATASSTALPQGTFQLLGCSPQARK